MLRGTCWKALDINPFLDFCMLLSKALISNSRALMKEATLSSPDVDRAASAAWTGIARASCAFCRFRELVVCDIVALRFWPAACGGVGAITFHLLHSVMESVLVVVNRFYESCVGLRVPAKHF